MLITPTAPRFEHHLEALGIPEAAPRLSWIVPDAPEGWEQIGYEVEARRPGSAAIETARVDSGASVLVPWPFAPLRSRDSLEVRVRPLGSDATPVEWSQWSRVEAGLLGADEYPTSMIAPADDAWRAPLLRRAFTIPEDRAILSACLRSTARGLVRAEINGMRASDEELAPGWTAYESRLIVRTDDVTALVRPGANALGLALGDGWWRGRLGWSGESALYGETLSALVVLEVTLDDGSRIDVLPDESWRSAPGPRRSADLYDGEEFDARLADPAWSTPAFDDSDWEPARLVDVDPAILVGPLAPPVRVVEMRSPVEVFDSPNGGILLDFGQNLVGRARIRLRTGEGSGVDAGHEVVLRHAEVLENGALALEPLRTAKATDRYICAGSGEEEWAPAFTFHGFRYLEVTGWPADQRDALVGDDPAIRAEVLSTVMERTGRFDCSDPLLARFHENVVQGMRSNFLSLPTDCPQRDERLGWTGDLEVFAPVATFLYDASGILTNWLADLAAEQARYGGTPNVVPAIVTGYQGPMAAWGDAATVVPWTLYEASGDVELLRAQLPSMRVWVDEVAAAAGDSLIWSAGYQFGDWLDPDAPAENPSKGKCAPEIVATAYFARSARILADAASIVGDVEVATTYSDLAERVREAFIAEFVTPSGRLMSDAQTAYALALAFDLLPESAREGAAARLADLVKSAGYRISTGFVGTPLVTGALAANGHADVAYRLLLQTEAPSWLYPVTKGATTVWERWDSLLPDGTVNPSGMTSFNHYALGAVADWMHRTVAGLAPAEPGWRRLEIAPIPPKRGLDSASASLLTPYGEAASSWRLEDGELHLDVRVPVGATARVVLPSGAIHEVGHGVHSFRESFEVDAAERPHLDLDTPLGVLAEVDGALDLLAGAVEIAIPGSAEHTGAGIAGQEGVTARQISGMLPHSERFLAGMERGFAALNAGEPVPVDLTVAGVRAARAAEEAERTANATAADTADASESRNPVSGEAGRLGLTLEEKASLLSGEDFWSTKAIESRGIPKLVLTDGPHGVRLQDGESDHLGLNAARPATCFPPAVAVGSSWNPALAAEIGRAVGEEGRSLGVDVVLGPGVNIKRSPLGGRNFEYYSEDPTLSGALGAAHVAGMQEVGVGASLKHFVANDQETDRMRVSAEVDERTLREIYLASFERVVKEARPATVMCAYNRLNGVFCSHNPWLLTTVLREEWGFEGLVVSDWGAVSDRVAGVAAGMDLEMPGSGGANDAKIVEAVRNGSLSEDAVDASVARVLALAAAKKEPNGPFDADAHHALARRAAAECAVLLKNEDALPLSAGQRIAVIGAMAETPRYQGGGSSHINATRVDSPLDEIRALADARGSSVARALGYAIDEGADARALLEEAVEAAAGSDVAVVFAGLPEKEESEGFDRTTLDIPESQVALIRAVAAAAPKTVVVLMNGGVVSLEGFHDEVDAILEGFLLGQGAGGAIADLLFGEANPSGHLAESIPLRLEDTPSWANFPGEQGRVRYGEGVFVGYRYYASAGAPVRYPFGHGLSYTTFKTDGLEAEKTGEDSAVVRVRVTNTGGRAGAHVVQVYVAAPSGPVRRPVRELRGFEKVALEPGESTTVEIVLDRRSFAYWDVEREDWVVPEGTAVVEVCANAHEVLASAPIDLAGDSFLQPLTMDSTVGEWFGHPVVGPLLMEGMAAGMTEEQRAQADESADMLRMVESMPMRQFVGFLGGAMPPEALEGLMALSRGEGPTA
ncbi:family 78 glycoside hydrolase catalytic domain [Actinomyces culturomici]|uniref:family 78 glycoside hydrolase catalytic domain n=1 Tax=Actinomyces culturomici TaxID=1926276 RepID=UPI001C551206|nr:family 78 glycoside hydrolase catalytic domain [Actinomyces culturomici]